MPPRRRVSTLRREGALRLTSINRSTHLFYNSCALRPFPWRTGALWSPRWSDLRVEKAFPIDRDRRISMFVGVFNLLNANPELTVSWSPGARLGTQVRSCRRASRAWE